MPSLPVCVRCVFFILLLRLRNDLYCVEWGVKLYSLLLLLLSYCIYVQDTFLPHVESGTIILVGATTENPSFHINSALLSRCHVIVLEKLSIDDLRTVVDRALVQLGITKVVSAADVASVEVSVVMFVILNDVKC